MAQKLVGVRFDVGVIRGLELRAHHAFTPGDSRHVFRLVANAVAEINCEPKLWALTDEKIRAHKTLQGYFSTWVRFARWARDRHGANKWGKLVVRADDLASAWLRERVVEGKSGHTLKTDRSALRLLFENRTLAQAVRLPRRTGAAITKSRRPAKRDAEFQPDRWRTMIEFARAVGTRRAELRHVRVCDVRVGADGSPVEVHLGANSSAKGGRERDVELLPHQRQAVATALAEAQARGAAGGNPLFPNAVDQKTGQVKPWARVPVRMDVHALRREYAQDVYRRLPQKAVPKRHNLLGRGLPLPHSAGRLKSGMVDKMAAGAVAVRLGHSCHRIDTVVKHYLR